MANLKLKTSLAFSDPSSEYDYLKRLSNNLIYNLEQKERRRV